MPMPQRVSRLSIVLAFLLVRHSYAAAGSTEEPFTQYKSNDDKYDLVDVAEQQGKTGSTSRFYTNDDVDDDFWLKQLGEDFKRAIHLQVDGNEQYNGVYNMSEDGSAYQVQQEFIQKQNPVQANYDSQQSTAAYNYSTEPQPTSTTTRTSSWKDNNRPSDNSYRAQQYIKVNSEQTPSNSHSKNATNDNDNYEQSYERIFTHDDAGVANSIYSAGRKPNHKYTKIQLINMKYTAKPSHSHKDPAAKNAKSNYKSSDNKSAETPIVVDLPDNDKSVVHLNENDTPVVVKMPPVIYHRNPSYEADDTETQTQQQSHTYPHTEPAQATSTHYIEYPQNSRKQQFPQFQLQQQQHQQHQHQQQHQPAHQFPLQQQEQQPQQHTHYHQYTAQNFYSPTPYGETSPPFSPQNTYQTGGSSSNDATHDLRYILSKHSSTYSENKQEQSESNYPDYNRISRSSQDLYEQGL